MTALTTFYLSNLLGLKIYTVEDQYLGRIADLLALNNPDLLGPDESNRPQILAIKVTLKHKIFYFEYSHFQIIKANNRFTVICHQQKELDPAQVEPLLALKENILDRQIVDLNGRKLVRVNDIRLVAVPSGTFVMAVDVGAEGLLRRIGIDKAVKPVFSALKAQMPSRFILWDEVDTLDASNFNIRLGKPLTKLQTLHPSDLADIIEDLGRNSRTNVFSNLDEEHAADVLEEMEPKSQVDLIDSLPVEKVADVLEKMPADEAADILDLLEDEKAEHILREMEAESSEEVRELLHYADRQVGSIMNTDFVSFHVDDTVEKALFALRELSPEESEVYSMFVLSHNGRLQGTISLRQLILSEPGVFLRDIMKKDPVSVHDSDRLDSLAEIVSKYNMLAVPVVNKNEILEGMVVIDDIVDDLLGERRTS